MGDTQSFIRLESLAGLLLLATTVLGMIFANSQLASIYEALLSTPLEVRLGEASLAKPLLLWVNDGLMAIFFLLVALELKREVMDGDLSQPGQVALPLVAALGGIAIPAAIYALWNLGDAQAIKGWAIPAATDIAFALGVLMLLGNKVPTSLKTFLLSLAVFDDLGAILIIAAFYTEEISWAAKGLGLGGIGVLAILNRLGITRLSPYLLIGSFVWVCVLKSGVHATLAGVAVGLAIPLRAKDDLGHSPLKLLEHSLHPWVALLVIPVFAFANSGVDFSGVSSAELSSPVTLGIASGLFFGKLIGVFGTAALLIRFGPAALPKEASWTSFLGVCILSGIGFTMSLFIGTLAFEHSAEDFSVQVRLGVIGASVLSALIGFAVLRHSLPSKP